MQIVIVLIVNGHVKTGQNSLANLAYHGLKPGRVEKLKFFVLGSLNPQSTYFK